MTADPLYCPTCGAEDCEHDPDGAGAPVQRGETLPQADTGADWPAQPKRHRDAIVAGLEEDRDEWATLAATGDEEYPGEAAERVAAYDAAIALLTASRRPDGEG